MSNTIIPTAVLQEVMDAMDDMATDSRLLDMKQSRVHGFDAARDALRAALDNLQCGREQNLNMIQAGWKMVPVEPNDDMDAAAETDYEKFNGGYFPNWKHAYRAMLAAAPQPPTTEQSSVVQPQVELVPYLWYDPENGDTWTQEAVDEGFCATDGLIPLYTK